MEDLKQPDPTIREVGARILLRHLRRMIRFEAGARTGLDIEDVHRMRVASRRLRAGARVFRSAFGKRLLAPFLDELRKVAVALGQVRDLDVFLEWLEEYVKQAPRAHQPGLRKMLVHYQNERGVHHGALLVLLDAPGYQDFKASFTDFLRHGPAARPKGERPVRFCAPRWIERQWKRVRRYEALLEQEPTPAHLHRLRIALRRLRYVVEFFRPQSKREAKRFIDDLVELQDCLGAIHDSDVHCLLIEGFAANPVGGAGRRSSPSAIQQRALQTALRTRRIQQTNGQEDFLKIWGPFLERAASVHLQQLLTRLAGDPDILRNPKAGIVPERKSSPDGKLAPDK